MKLTEWAGGVCLDDAAEICDGLLQESAFPVQHVPDGGQETHHAVNMMEKILLTSILYYILWYICLPSNIQHIVVCKRLASPLQST